MLIGITKVGEKVEERASCEEDIRASYQVGPSNEILSGCYYRLAIARGYKVGRYTHQARCFRPLQNLGHKILLA